MNIVLTFTCISWDVDQNQNSGCDFVWVENVWVSTTVTGGIFEARRIV